MEPVLRALVEPRRRDILQLVQAREMSSGEIAAHFSITRPAISQHLGTLEAAGLVSVRREGTKRLYRAQLKGLAELREYLEGFWEQHLRQLANAAEAEERRNAMTSGQGNDVFEKEVRIAARPETIFPFFTDPAKMALWMSVEQTLDPTPGGVFRVNITGRDIVAGRYVEISPPNRVVLTFGWEGDDNPLPPGSSTLEITLVADGAETVLTLRHSGLSSEQRDSHGEGWEHYLERLVIATTGGDPGTDPWTATPAETA